MRSALRLCALLALLLPAAGSAQRAQFWRDSSMRIDSALRHLQDSMVHGDSATAEVGRHGPLVVAASPDQKAIALRMFAEFTRVTDRYFHGALPGPSGFHIAITTDTRQGYGNDLERTLGKVILVGMPDSGHPPEYRRSLRPETITPEILQYYGEMMIAGAPGSLGRWLGFTPTFSMPEQERRRVTMYGLVTGSGRIQRACINGDIDACAQAFELRPGSGENAGAYLPAFLRGDLLLFALESGGPGSWERLTAASTSGVAPGLSAAMQMPIDSVIAKWRTRLLTSRPTSAPWSSSRAVLALAWIGIALAATWGAARWA